MALINWQQIKHGQALANSITGAVDKSAIVTTPSEVPSDDLIPSETYMQTKLDELAASMSIHVEASLETPSVTPTSELTLPSIPNDDPVKLIINGIEYKEGKDFTVERSTSKVMWAGEFPLTADTVDSIKAMYTTKSESQNSGFPKARHIVGMVLAEEGSHNNPTYRYDPDSPEYIYNTAKGDWRRIDTNYNEVDFDPEHGTWAGIQEVTTNLDGALKYFIEIPTTWVKNEVIQSGEYAGCNCWWIADGEAPGFHIHPAFIKPDGTPGKLRIGKYLAALPENVKSDVHAYIDPSIYVDNIYYDLQSLSYNNLRAKALSYNTAEESGYRAYSIYDHHFIARMILTEFGNPNIFFYQSYYDNDEWYEQVSVSGLKMENPPSEAQQHIDTDYHGIKYLLSDEYANCLLDGLTTLNGTYQLLAADGSGTMVETGVPCPQKGTWLTNCYMTKVNGVDFGDVFINDGRNAISDKYIGEDPFESSDNNDNYFTMKNGSFCDYQYILPNKATCIQHEAEYTYCGIFMLNSVDVDQESDSEYTCWRLVQVV